MKKRIFELGIIIITLLTSCGQIMPTKATPIPVRIPTALPTTLPTISPTTLPAESPTSTPNLNNVDPSAILFEQNFELGEPYSLSTNLDDWITIMDSNGKHSYCNISRDNYVVATFGNGQWTDYAVELRIMEIEQHEDPWVAVYARYVPNSNTGYYGALNFQTTIANLALNNPYRNLANQSFPTTATTWYTLRLEVAGQQVKYYINDHLIGDGTDSTLSQGEVGFGISPHLKVCIDDIRVWALTDTGAIGKAPVPYKPNMEIVSDKAATGDGGNAWGGHQTHIVRTNDGVFTAYTIEGGGYYDKKWQLARRQDDGSWPVIAQGDAGREPVNLLASPDGTLHIIGWPNGRGTMWSGRPSGNTIEMTTEVIPNMAQSDWPYGSAGIDKAGNICVLSSVGGETPGGTFEWACYLPSHGKWISQTTFLDYRYCYSYLFPDPSGSLAVVSTRDVRWGVLGYSQPAGQFDYVFNALGYWRTDDLTKDPLKRLYFLEEKPTVQFPAVTLDAQEDAYLDTAGNMHILYQIQGASTKGAWILRQAILSPDGQLLKDVPLPDDIGGFARIFQDANGRFYILGSSGLLYPAGSDGTTFGSPTQIDLKDYSVEYSGFGISAPRTGTLPGNVLDVVFPSSSGQMWIYFQLTLPGN